MVNLTYQWDIGDTRISAACAGLDRAGDTIFRANFTRQSDTSELIPKIALRCTLRGHLLGSVRRDFDMPPLAIWVDFHNEDVTNQYGVLLASVGAFHADDGVIDFSIENASGKNEREHVTISRSDGVLNATLRSDESGNVSITGNCEKVESLGNRF